MIPTNGRVAGGYDNVLNAQADMVRNLTSLLTSRANFFNNLWPDKRRNVPEELGYDDTYEPELYFNMYRYEGAATRTVSMLPLEAMKLQPTVYEKEKAKAVTEFELAVDSLGTNLRGPSLFKTEAGSVIWTYLLRAMILARIGHYGVLLLGIDDGKDLMEPARGLDPFTGKETSETRKPVRKLIFLRPFAERHAMISAVVKDTSSPRFGLPEYYSLEFANPETLMGFNSGAGITETKRVHWTRVIHIADNAESGDLYGTPEMMSVFRYLLNIVKVGGGSAEMFWRAAQPGLSIESHPNVNPREFINQETGELVPAVTQMREQGYDYMQGQDKMMGLMGMTAKVLATQPTDPTPFIKAQMELICVAKGWPMRKFLGSERGELASSSDDGDWNDDLKEYQERQLKPGLIVPFFDRCIHLGVLPRPTEFHVDFPDLNALNDVERADIAVKRVEAITKFASGGGEMMMAPFDFWTREMGYSEEEATAITEAAATNIQEKRDEVATLAEEGMNPDGTPMAPDPNDPEVVKATAEGAAKIEGAKAKAKAENTPVKVAANTEAGKANSPFDLAGNMAAGQPRVPSGPHGGEWTDAKGAGGGKPSAPNLPSGSGNGVITDKKGTRWEVRHEAIPKPDGKIIHEYKVHDKNGHEIARASLARTGESIFDVGVSQDFQRRGIASALYTHIESHLGYALKPSRFATDEGAALWKSRGVAVE